MYKKVRRFPVVNEPLYVAIENNDLALVKQIVGNRKVLCVRKEYTQLALSRGYLEIYSFLREMGFS